MGDIYKIYPHNPPHLFRPNAIYYVHTNPVKHGLVKDALDYPFCSDRWFVEQGTKDFQKEVFSQPFDKQRLRTIFNLNRQAGYGQVTSPKN